MRDATFLDVVNVQLPPGLRGQLIDAARARGATAGEYIRQVLKSAVSEAGSPDPNDDRSAGRDSRSMESGA